MKVLLLAAAICASTLAMSAQNTGNTGSVTGRVMDADTRSPLAGVSVGSREIGYVVTDQEGRYLLRGLKPGRLSFSILSGYMQNPWPDKVVTVIEGRELSGVDFRYRLDAQISGRVLDEDGNPVPGVRVMALTREFGPDGETNYDRAGAGVATTTDDRGAYAITSGVRAGRSYRLMAYPVRRYPSAISDSPADPSSRRRILAATFYPSADSLATAEPIVPRSLERRTADIRMLKKPAYCLEATLVAGSAPGTMTFVLAEDERYSAEFRGGLPSRQEGGSSGADGRIRLCDLSPGRYRLAVFPADSTPLRPPAFFDTVPITIVDRDLQNILINTLPPATVSGEVAWDSPPSDPGVLQSTLRITLDPAPWVLAPRTEVSIPSQFTFPVIHGRRYSMIVNIARPGLYVKDVTLGGTSILRKPYDPSSERLRITIGHDGGLLRARVVGTNGQPAIYSAVIVFPANVLSEVELSTTMVEGFTNEDGEFQTPTLRPGRYIVLATDDPPPYVSVGDNRLNIQRSPEALARLLRARARGQPVEIGPRATIQVNLTSMGLE